MGADYDTARDPPTSDDRRCRRRHPAAAVPAGRAFAGLPRVLRAAPHAGDLQRHGDQRRVRVHQHADQAAGRGAARPDRGVLRLGRAHGAAGEGRRLQGGPARDAGGLHAAAGADRGGAGGAARSRCCGSPTATRPTTRSARWRCRPAEQGIDATIVTADRDFFQLVRPGITVMFNRKGISDIVRYDEAAVTGTLRHHAGAVPGLRGAQGGPQRQHPRRAGGGGQDRGQARQPVRRRSRSFGAHRPAQGQAEGERRGQRRPARR